MATMYSMKPLYDLPANIELPEVMYKLSRTQGGENLVRQKVSPLLVTMKCRQDDLITRLDDLLEKVSSLETQTKPLIKDKSGAITDFVIHASPDRPPQSLKFIHRLLKRKFNVLWKIHWHSSLTKQPQVDAKWCNEECLNRSGKDIVVTIIFKKVEREPVAFISPSMTVPIHGEANIARLFGRYLGIYDCGRTNNETTIKTDVILDTCDVISSHFTQQQEKLAAVQAWSAILNTSSWLMGDEATIADAVALSALQNSDLKLSCQRVKDWLRKGNDLLFS